MPPKISPDPGSGQQIDLSTLQPQQLAQVKKQLDEEMEHLNSSYTQLRSAQARFGDCVRSINEGVAKRAEGDQILVPLTTSLYVPGRLKSKEKVLVDVGTGFYVEKTTDKAIKFYTEKTKEIGANLKDLEGILQGKTNNLRIVEEVLRQKMVQAQDGDKADGS
ncbi:MAG: subunit of tubulin prefoldin [Chrysothrix sp. TS-e1954]|nr:MAG: subunit of tubulin prefoldin [Chrysothrix sp. TS-e1954]